MKYLIFSLFILCVACKSEVTAESADSVDSNSKALKNFQPDAETLSKEIINDRPWKIEIVLDNGKITKSNPWESSIVSFSENDRYTWKGTDFESQGKYELDTEKNIITLKADNPSENSEWSIKYRGSAMVWIGTPQYGQHSMQLKLVQQR